MPKLKRQITPVLGVQDLKVSAILGDLKAIIEEMTGRSPYIKPLKKLGAAPTLAGCVDKINEIIDRLQGDA